MDGILDGCGWQILGFLDGCGWQILGWMWMADSLMDVDGRFLDGCGWQILGLLKSNASSDVSFLFYSFSRQLLAGCLPGSTCGMLSIGAIMRSSSPHGGGTSFKRLNGTWTGRAVSHTHTHLVHIRSKKQSSHQPEPSASRGSQHVSALR